MQSVLNLPFSGFTANVCSSSLSKFAIGSVYPTVSIHICYQGSKPLRVSLRRFNYGLNFYEASPRYARERPDAVSGPFTPGNLPGVFTAARCGTAVKSLARLCGFFFVGFEGSADGLDF
jgi:hypothetical protein